MPTVRRLKRLTEMLLLLGAVAALLLATPFTLFQLGLAACLGIGVLGLKLLSGLNGQFSLGHSVFFAVGAYTAAILVESGVNYYLTLPLAAAAAFAVGFALGLPALRIRGFYLAVMTLVLAIAAPLIAGSTLLAPLTGGPEGIGIPRLSSPFAGLSDGEWWFILVVAVAIALWVGAIAMTGSRFGRSMRASYDHEVAARSIGINVAAVNTMTFGISAAYAGVAGALMIGQLGYVGPESFELIAGLGLFVAFLMTGPSWLGGAFVGGIFLQLVPSVIEDMSAGVGLPKQLTWAVYGVALLAIVYLQILAGRARAAKTATPDGVGGVPRR